MALDQWAERAKVWAAGGVPSDLPKVEASASGKSSAAKKGKSGANAEKSRPVFVFFISGAKVRAPIAAEALIERLKA